MDVSWYGSNKLKSKGTLSFEDNDSLKNGKQKDVREKSSNSKSPEISLKIAAYGNDPDNAGYTYQGADKKDKEKGCFDRILDIIKCPCTSQEAQNESKESGPTEIMRHKPPQNIDRQKRRTSTRSQSSTESNYVPLHTSAMNYMKKLISDIRGVGRWDAITFHFKDTEWLGEDDVTNLIRLAAACLPFPQKFAWLPQLPQPQYIENDEPKFVKEVNNKGNKISNNAAKLIKNDQPVVLPLQKIPRLIAAETNSSTGKRGRPKGSVAQKTVYNESRRENALQQAAASVLESMNEQQLLYYNLSVTKTGKVQRELDVEKLRSQELQKQMSLLQKLKQQQAEQIETEKASTQVAVENYEREKEQRKIAEQKWQNHIQAMIEMQRTAALEKKESAKQNLILEKNVADLQKANDKLHAAAKEENDKNKEMVRKTQQRRVQRNVQELKEVPDMAKKVLARFQQKTENKKHKITPLQTVAMTVIVGFNPNQLENMKSLLRFFKMDILPPVHLIRKTLKTLKEDFQYIEFEDKELEVVGRQVSDIKNVIKVRAERLIESGRWVDIPGFEGYAFIGLSADSVCCFTYEC
uniref:Uncharacterized protein n=1 Tax=Panagrolaimus davidi TaxID=227884 RepID=A0A914P6U2_9BILA